MFWLSTHQRWRSQWMWWSWLQGCPRMLGEPQEYSRDELRVWRRGELPGERRGRRCTPELLLDQSWVRWICWSEVQLPADCPPWTLFPLSPQVLSVMGLGRPQRSRISHREPWHRETWKVSWPLVDNKRLLPCQHNQPTRSPLLCICPLFLLLTITADSGVTQLAQVFLGHSVSKVEKTVFSWGISYFFG